MASLGRALAVGAAAGAAGTTALNAVTYLDMAVRGRPTSDTPERTVERLADELGVEIPGDPDTRSNRVAGLGPLTGIAAGVGVGIAGGLLAGRVRLPLPLAAVVLGAAAMAASDGSMAALGVTDPRTWPASSWLADLVPHLAYGAVTAAVLELGRAPVEQVEEAVLRRLPG
ncbi:MAG: putative rane protein [Mycobacterium sp.]|nr:putative rane protein [Mycobacterium sp.]MCW2746583.1 putative rane protein [Mycobacterium sp.]